MKNKLLILSDGIRLTYTSTKNRIFPPRKYIGTVEEICRSIIRDCFHKEKKYFRVSPHNFKEFYARDFGMCCESLIRLGYGIEVEQTLTYAMDIYMKAGKITTQITPRGASADFPSHTPESASYMLNSLMLLGNKKLIDKYKKFFEEIAGSIYQNDIDKQTGLLRKDMHFSSMKDHALRHSDCYNNCFVALLALNLKKIGIKSEFDKHNYTKIIRDNFLVDGYFLEDLSGSTIIAGDANVFPFWTKIFDCSKKGKEGEENKKLLKRIIKKMQTKKLDAPWPLKYTSKEDAPRKLHATNILVPGYETDTIWMHLGLCYLKILPDADKKLLAKHLKEYAELIEKHKTFYEVYDSDGTVFSRALYKSDEAMLWCSIFLELYVKEHKINKIKSTKNKTN